MFNNTFNQVPITNINEYTPKVGNQNPHPWFSSKYVDSSVSRSDVLRMTNHDRLLSFAGDHNLLKECRDGRLEAAVDRQAAHRNNDIQARRRAHELHQQSIRDAEVAAEEQRVIDSLMQRWKQEQQSSVETSLSSGFSLSPEEDANLVSADEFAQVPEPSGIKITCRGISSVSRRGTMESSPSSPSRQSSSSRFFVGGGGGGGY
jgi:hypothetical protein